MAVDKAKLLKSAEKYIASGKIQLAVEEYQKILKENPKDWNLMIQIGDLCLKINKNADAIQHFQKVADHYYSDGFFLKAIAIYKRINKLDPSITEICIKLADLYLKQGLSMDAKSQLQAVAQHYVSKNQNKEAIQTFKKLIEIEPDNLKIRNELAKAYKQEGMLAEAIKEYLEISDELTRKNLWKESLAVLETAYKLEAGNTGILRKILTIYNEQNEGAKAATLLEDAMRVDPSNPEILSLLAETYAAKNQPERAQETLDRAILGTTVKEPFWILKGDLYLKAGDIDRAYSQYSLVVERFVQKREVEKGVALLQKVTREDPAYHPALQRLVDLYSSLHQESNMLSACNALVDAYISKAKYVDAAKYLEKLMSYEPDNAQHQSKLEFVRSFLEKPKPKPEPKPAPPVEMEVMMPDIPETTDSEDFDISLDLSSVMAAPAVEEKPAPTMAPPRPAAAQQQVAARPKPAPAVALGSEEEREFVSEHLIEAEVFTKYGLIDKAIEQLQLVIQKYPTAVLAHQKMKEIFLEKGERDKAVESCVAMSRIFRKQGDLDQAEDLLSEARQISPNHPALEKAFREMPEATAAPAKADVMGEIEKLAQSMKSKPAPAKPQPAVKKAAPPPPPDEEIEIEMDEEEAAPATAALSESSFEEIDFYASQGLGSEAKRLLNDLKKKHPDDPGILKRLAKLGEPVAPAKPAAKPVPKAPEPVVEEYEEEIPVSVEEEASIAIPEEPAPEVAIEEPVEEPTIEQTWDLGSLSDLAELKEQSKEPQEEEVAAPELEEPEELSEPVEEEEQLEELPLEIPSAPVESEEEVPELSMEPLAPVEELETPQEVEEPPQLVGLESEEEEPEVLLEPVQPEPEPEPEPEPVPEPEEMAELQPEPVEVMPEPIIEAEPAEPEAEVETVQPPESEEASTSFEDLEPTDFGELDASAETKTEPEAESPMEGAEEEFGAALDAAFVAPAETAPEEEVQSTPVKASEELFEEEDDYFDLASELEDSFLNVQSAVEEERPADGQNYSLEEILSDFKKGVEKQLGSEDYDTRYNLGIAYKEMGLIDEAIAEFQIASKDSRRFLECCSMLGLCFVEKGMPKLALKWYQKGLETPGHTEDEYQGLRFDLAHAYEATGEPAKALETYQEVYGINATYRNVSKKIKELQDQVGK